MLKRSVSSLDDVEENFRGLYEEKAGKFVLKLEGDDPAFSSLKNEKQTLSEKLRLEKEAREAAEARLAEIDSEAEKSKAKKSGNFEELEASWNSKYDKLKNDYEKRISEMNSHIESMMLTSQAEKIAHEISNTPRLLARELKERMRVEYEDGKPSLKILDAEGKLSALTLDELKQEFVDNPDFAHIIIATRANGGGTADQRHGSGASAKKISEMTGAERIAYYRKNPQKFEEEISRDNPSVMSPI